MARYCFIIGVVALSADMKRASCAGFGGNAK
jgi:hypothetical protein